MLNLTLLRIGWRNLWRNPRRTVITSLAIAIGMIILAFILSIMAGMKRDMIDHGTELLLGHVQIHHTGYRPDRSIFDVIPGDGHALAARARSHAEVRAVAPRVSAFGLVSSGSRSIGAEILGIDRDAENEVTVLADKLISGRLPANGGSKEIAIGKLAASTLGVAQGDELVVITQAADGSLGNDLYSVTGIFRTGLDMFDGGIVLLDLRAAQELLALEPGQLHEIAIRTMSPVAARQVADSLAAAMPEDLEIAPWQILMPELSSWVAMSDSWSWIMYVIVFALAAISVLNTMLMSVFERLREFGVMAAIGMKPVAIVALVIVEVAALAVVSLVVATAIGWPIINRVVETGLDLSGLTGGFSLSGVAVGPIIRGDWVVGKFAVAGALLVSCAILAGLYPATRAARADPALLTKGEIR